MKKYYQMWNEIPMHKRPRPGEVYICLDSQKRLGEGTWSVSVMSGGVGNHRNDNIQLGLFRREEIAEMFAKMAGMIDNVKELQIERGWVFRRDEIQT